MLRDFLKNPLTLLYVLVLSLTISVGTIVQITFSTLTPKKLDQRIRWWSRSLLDFIKTDYRVHNPHGVNLSEGKPTIIMCNHCSHFDIPLSFMALPGSIRMLAKKELLEIPIWGRAMRLSDFVAIDRFNPRQALKDMRYAKKVMEKGIALWIAPEGTRSANGKLQPFKPGGFRLAIECGATIIPLGIVGSDRIMAAKSLVINRKEKVDIYVGQPIDTSGYSKRQKDELLKVVENEIRHLVEGEKIT